MSERGHGKHGREHSTLHSCRNLTNLTNAIFRYAANTKSSKIALIYKLQNNLPP